MKRLLTLATTLTTLRKLALTLLCCTVLMVFAAPAQVPPTLVGAPKPIDTGAFYGMFHKGTDSQAAEFTLSGSAYVTTIDVVLLGDGIYTAIYDFSLQNSLTGPITTYANATLTAPSAGPNTETMTVNATLPAGTYYLVGTADPQSTLSLPGWYISDGTTFITNAGSVTNGVWYSTTGPAGSWFFETGSSCDDICYYYWTPRFVVYGSTTGTLTVTELGLGAGTVTDNSSPPAINCSEASGIVTGTCSATYPIETTTVTLTASPGSSSSTFAGWGGACATSGSSATCTVNLSSAQNVTANFMLTPVSVDFTLPPGTAVTAMATVACPNNPNPYPGNPCTDPNGVGARVTVPQLPSPVQARITFAEKDPDGLCPAADILAGGQSDDFDCRFLTYSTQQGYGNDSAGDAIVPLCYPYANGNCVVISLTGQDGNPLPAGSFPGGAFLKLTYNNDQYTPTGYWAGSTPRLFIDPGSDELPPLPWGTDCSTAMSPSAGQNPPSPPIYCQFEADITTYYNPTEMVDSGIGSKIPPTGSDFVVAFKPTNNLNNPNFPAPPADSAPTFTSLSSTTFTEGTPGVFEVTTTGGYPAPVLTIAPAAPTTAVPAWLIFDAGIGLLSGTPPDGAAGSYYFTITATSTDPVTHIGLSTPQSFTLTVSAAALTITASSATVAYGTGIPTITPIVSGLVNGDMASVLGITCSAAVPAGNPVGTYATTCSGALDPTYAITYVPGTLQITAVPLTITASSATITYGGTVPVITPTFTPGLVNGDTATTLGVTCTTTATSASLPGSYPSSCTASNGGNYTITYTPGTVTVVGLEISPLTVNFGQLYLWQFGGQFITLKNTGTTPITISSINHAGGTAPGDYGDVSLCPPMIVVLPARLPAGKSCVIGVGIWATAKVFSPTASTTTLTITDSAATQTVLLTAQVTDPQVSLSSTSLSFGKQKTGTTSTPPQKVTLTNSGLTPLQLTGLTISGNFALASGAGTNCTTLPMLSPGTTCFIYVTFTPTSKGSKSGSVTITDLTLLGKQTISLTGTGD